MAMKNILVAIITGVLAIMLAACGDGGAGYSGSSISGAGGGNLGATAGGVQDMTYARNEVESGRVPPETAFSEEGMYSEHDLPLEGDTCVQVLCVRSALGIAPDTSGNSAAWVQLGLGSNIDSASFQREPITVVAVVDTSGSMSGGFFSGGPIDTAKTLLTTIASKLTVQDRIAIIGFGQSVYSQLPLTTGGSGAINIAINSLYPSGSTNMEAGLRRGYEVAAQAKTLNEASNVRVMLFTDLQPNVGATVPSEFERIALDGANAGTELTVFGLGQGLGSQFLQAMSYMRGANAFTLNHVEDVAAFMGDNWPWMVSPLAYDLTVTATVPAGLRIVDTYGFPDNGTAGEAGFDVATVFLSKKRGALLLKLYGETLQTLPIELSVTYTYTDTNNTDQESIVTVAYEGQLLDENGLYMPQTGIAKTVALTLLVTELKKSAALYLASPRIAVETLSAALSRFNVHAALLNDPDINREAVFWQRMLELMRSRAAQAGNNPAF